MALSYMRIFTDNIELVDAFPSETLGDTIKALLHYLNDGTEPSFPAGSIELVAWHTFKMQLDRDIAAHDAKVEAGSGKKQNTSKPKQTEAEGEQTEAEASKPKQKGSRTKQMEAEGEQTGAKYPNNRNLNHNRIHNLNRNLESTEDDEEQLLRARVREFLSAWERYYGTEPTGVIAEEAVRRSIAFGFEDGVLDRAVERTAQFNPASPFDYLMKLLGDWKASKCRTVDDVDSHFADRDVKSGKVRFRNTG